MPVATSTFLASFLLHDNVTPTVPFGHPLASVRQEIENFFPSPMGVRHTRTEYSTATCLLALEFEDRLGPIPTRSRSVPCGTHPLSRCVNGPSQLLRMSFVRLDVVALEQ